MKRIESNEGRQMSNRQAGAFGKWWRVFDEVEDSSVVRQITNVSCVSACGEMLSEGRVSQTNLLEVLGDGMKSYTVLVEALNMLDEKRYEGGFCEPDDLWLLMKLPRWVAFMLSGQPRSAHAVVIKGVSEGRICVLDPSEGTKYTVDKRDFIDDMWSGIAVWSEGP